MSGFPFNTSFSTPFSRDNGKPRNLKTSGKEIAGVIIRPNNSDSYVLTASLNQDGKITRKGLNGEECLGQVDPKGNFSLKNGDTGNVFSSKTVLLNGYQDDKNPFALSLKATERERAIQGSELGIIRKSLTSKGIDGRGIKIGILDSHEKNKKEETWKESAHSKVVAAMIQDPQYGIAQGAQVEDLGENISFERELKSDDEAALKDLFVGNLCESYQKRGDQLQKLIDRRDPSLRILNNTQGSSRIQDYNTLWKAVNQKNDEGYLKFPKIRDLVLGKTVAGTSQEQYQAVVDYIDTMYDSSEPLKKARQHYIEMTKKTADAGITIICAAGNCHGDEKFPARLKPGCEMDHFAQSPYVISVAAADTNQKPGERTKYKLAEFSSRGDGEQWNPTIAAPGSEMPISLPVERLGHNLSVNGTSFSTPFTCGVVAMMLQRNPDLTFAQIKARLQSTATPVKGYTKSEQGAGMLNAEAAVLG